MMRRVVFLGLIAALACTLGITFATVGGDFLSPGGASGRTELGSSVDSCEYAKPGRFAAQTLEPIGPCLWISLEADGLPRITFYDAFSRILRMARCSNPYCIPAGVQMEVQP